jgi:uncharacterized protein (DUF2141 family)
MIIKNFRAMFFIIYIVLCFFGMASVNLAIAKSSENNPVIIKVTGIKPEKGQVRIAVYDSAEKWLKQVTYAGIFNAESQEVEWKINDIPYGEYAIAVFHDENQNGEFDLGLLGISRETYGFSNNVKAFFGPPKWDKVKVIITNSTEEVAIELR